VAKGKTEGSEEEEAKGKRTAREGYAGEREKSSGQRERGN